MAETGRTMGGDLESSREEQTTSSAFVPPKLSDAVEMDTLSPDSHARSGSSTAGHGEANTHDGQPANTSLPDKTGSANSSQPSSGAIHTPTQPSAKALGKAPATTAESPEQDAIGPADSSQEPANASELTVDIMLILPATGNRHPFRINEKYLRKRNVNVTGVTEDGKMDPFSITVYTLKELILRDWRADWEAPPREPTSIRLIKMGKMLDDKLPLNQYNFTPNVKSIVHMTVKPQEIIDEEEANKRLKEPGSQAGRRGCCVVL